MLKVGTYACRVGGWSLTKSTQIPLPLNGLRPTDGPIIRLLLAFQKSAAFAHFNLSAVAEDTIATILSALWAFWSDLHGIPVDSYPQFCARLKELMPSRLPDGGDVTEQMADFVRWVKDSVGAVSAIAFRLTESVLNPRQYTLMYRPVDGDEIQEAVQELYGYRQMSYINIQADEGEGVGDSGSVLMKAWVLIHRPVMGSERLFVNDYDKPRYWDILCRYPNRSSEDDSSDEESGAAHPMSSEDPPFTETTREYATACTSTPDLLTSMEGLSIAERLTARVHVDNMPAGAQAVCVPHTSPQPKSIEEEQQGEAVMEDTAAGAVTNAPGLHSHLEHAQTQGVHREHAATCAPAIESTPEPTRIANAPYVSSNQEHAQIESAHREDWPSAEVLGCALTEHPTHELARAGGADTGDAAMRDVAAGGHTEYAAPEPASSENTEDSAEVTPTAHSNPDSASIKGLHTDGMVMEDTGARARTNALAVQLVHEPARAESAHTGDADMEDVAADGLRALILDSTHELVQTEGAHMGDAAMGDVGAGAVTPEPVLTERVDDAMEYAHTTTALGSIHREHTDDMAMEDTGLGANANAPIVPLTNEPARTDTAMEDAAADGMTCAPAVRSTPELMPMEHAQAEDAAREDERM